MNEDATGSVLAAGAVLWRDVAERVEVAVIHRPRYDDWSLPKGKVETGEHLLETALREVVEETGHGAVLGRPLGVASYLAQGRPKRVHYWAARAVDGAFVPHEEVDHLEWHPVDTARDRLHRDADRAVLDAFAGGPPRTSPLIVLRHAKALSRKKWQHEDEDRPLSADGVGQARRLQRLLAVWRPEHVVSSPSRRCVQTVEAYLDGRRLETAAVLSEQGHQEHPGLAERLLEQCLHDGRGAVLCSHRPVLPGLVDTVRGAADVRVALDLDGTPLRPAEMLVAHVTSGRVVAAERQRP